MRIISILLAALMLPLTVGAFAPQTDSPTKPYDVVPVLLLEEGQVEYLGTLDNYPVMYEIAVDATSTLPLQLAQRYRSEPIPFALIMIQVFDSGKRVKEVARLRPSAEDWTVKKESWLGFSLLESDVLETTIGPGTYRIEISTPDNIGKYMLTFGEESVYQDEPGFFSTLGSIRTTQSHFDYSVFRMLMSSYVYYPLGIILLLFVLQRTWKYRKMIRNVD